ncbi:MAG: DUF362 domain-containing protein [archaeon]|nr:DUF362 domain-containing protein [archaeon]
MIKVSIIKKSSYTNIDKPVKKAVALAGGLDIISSDRVLIKPNLMRATKPEDGITTHPEIVRAIMHLVKTKTDNISVGDGSGSKDLKQTEKALKTTGIKDAAKDIAKVVNFDREFQKVKIPNKTIKEILITKEISKHNYLITVPKMKTHCLTGITGATKNLYGCLYRTQKKAVHAKTPDINDFCNFLLDLYLLAKPKFALMDGITAMEGDGPSAGELKKANIILASKDALALDYICAKIMDFNAEKLPFFKIAIKRGLLNPEEIEIRGMPINAVRQKFKPPKQDLNSSTKIPAFIKKIYQRKLAVHKEICIKCGVCKKQCPVGAIELKPYPVFDTKKCIRCLCCHELCPKKAIYLKENLFFKIFKKLRL